ncbi:hypothetical protein Q3G72_019997 [Acer saccharum]|nr:hypothetical protein Q3G72_019997 [Acer saccharum]
MGYAKNSMQSIEERRAPISSLVDGAWSPSVLDSFHVQSSVRGKKSKGCVKYHGMKTRHDACKEKEGLDGSVGGRLELEKSELEVEVARVIEKGFLLGANFSSKGKDYWMD